MPRPRLDGPEDVGEKASPVLEIRDISVHYGEIRALSGISFSLEAGGFALVLGPNGAGKTSLVRAIAGAVRPRGGKILLQGRDVSRTPAFKRVRAGIALVPEGRGILRGLSVRDNLELAWRSSGPDRRGSKRLAINSTLDLFPILEERINQDCSTLSGGEMQMLAIARALLAKPAVLLLDEPSLGLAPQAIARVYQSLADLSEVGMAMVLVEQRAIPLERQPDLTLVLRGGRAIFSDVGKRPTDDQLASLYLGDHT